jgi:serine/threonine protein kinase
LARNVADGLNCVYKEGGLIHRDIAARNILVHRDGYHYIAKVADFELSVLGTEYKSEENTTPMPIPWLAPECVMKGTYDIKTDIYSFGVFLWELFSEQPPLPTDATTKIVPRITYQWPNNELPTLKRLVCDCLNVNCGARPTDWEEVYNRLGDIRAKVKANEEPIPDNNSKLSQVPLDESTLNGMVRTTPTRHQPAQLFAIYDTLLQQILTRPNDPDVRPLYARWQPIMDRVTKAMRDRKTELILGPDRMVIGVMDNICLRLQVFTNTAQRELVFGVVVSLSEWDVNKAVQLVCLAALRQNI